MIQQNQNFKQAAAELAKLLAIPAENVRIGVADAELSDLIGRVATSEGPYTRVIFTIAMPGIDTDREAAEKKIRDAMSRFPILNSAARIIPDNELIPPLLENLSTIIEGTDFDKRLLQWPGFQTRKWHVDDYTIHSVWSNPVDIGMYIHVPTEKEADGKAAADKVAANITQRLPAIKQALGERIADCIKHDMEKSGAQEADIQAAVIKASQQMQQLHISLKTDRSGSIEMLMQSAEQAQEAAKGKANRYKLLDENSENTAALSASNPVNLLSSWRESERRHTDDIRRMDKAIIQSILFAGDNAIDVFPLIAGRRDMHAALSREFARITQSHPEKQAACQKILDSNLFKVHNRLMALYEEPSAILPLTPIFSKDPKLTNTLDVTVNVPAHKVDEIIKELAGGISVVPTPAQSESITRTAAPATSSVIPAKMPAKNVMTITISIGGQTADASQLIAAQR